MASPIAAGEIVGELCRVIATKQQAAVITAGNLCNYTATGLVVAPAAAQNVGPFFLCVKTSLSTDATVSVLEIGEGYGVAQGAINVNSYLESSATVAGSVKAWAARTLNWSSDTVGIKLAAIDYQRVAGIYMGHVDEGWPTGGTPTNAADTDTVRFLLRDAI